MYSEFFHDFIKRGLLEAVGNRPDYWVMLNAANWMDKGALTEADLLEIQAAIDAKNAPPVEEGVEDDGENPDT